MDPNKVRKIAVKFKKALESQAELGVKTVRMGGRGFQQRILVAELGDGWSENDEAGSAADKIVSAFKREYPDIGFQLVGRVSGNDMKVAARLVRIAQDLLARNVKYVGFPKKFWVLTSQVWGSESIDEILFEVDMLGLLRQYRGGLNLQDVKGFYGSQRDGVRDAEDILRGKDWSVIKYKGFPKKFWVLTWPTPDSEMIDIYFETDMSSLYYQFKGGLDWNSVIGFYGNENAGKRRAEKMFEALKDDDDD